MRRLFVLAAILVMIPAVARAGGGFVDTSGCAGYAEGDTVSMMDSCFSGTTHFAPSGATITVRNDGELPHTLTAVDGGFDTGSVDPGATAQLTVDEPGVYRVFCGLHGTLDGEGMAGVLVVGEATPPSIQLPQDTEAISQAVAAETQAVLRAIEGQQSMLSDLDATDAEVLAALEQLEGGDTAAPQMVTVEGEIAPIQIIMLLLIGLAVGLALSSLLTVLRLRLADSRSTQPGQG